MALRTCSVCGRSCAPRDPAETRCGLCRAKETERQAREARARATPPPRQRRTCLRCDRVFWSWGPANRLCEDCRASLAQSASHEPTYPLDTRTRRHQP